MSFIHTMPESTSFTSSTSILDDSLLTVYNTLSGRSDLNFTRNYSGPPNSPFLTLNPAILLLKIVFIFYLHSHLTHTVGSHSYQNDKFFPPRTKEKDKTVTQGVMNKLKIIQIFHYPRQTIKNFTLSTFKE